MMRQTMRGLVWGLVLAMLPIFFATARIEAATLLFVPLDDRPVCLQYTVETLKAAGHEVLTPPEELLSTRGKSGDADKLWEWVFANANQADAAVLAADSLLYGGLVQSRTHEIEESVLTQRLNHFSEFKQRFPDIPMYGFSTIMRTPQYSAGGTEPLYYEKYGFQIYRLTGLWDKAEMEGLSAEEKQEQAALLAAIPATDLKDWMDRRGKNFRANIRMLEMTEKDLFRYFIIGRDDSWPYCQSHREVRQMEKMTSNLPRYRYANFSGADQLGLLLSTRSVNDLTYRIPFVYPFFGPGTGPKTLPSYQSNTIGETVAGNIWTLGGYRVPDASRADLVMAVGTPLNGVTKEAADASNTAALKPEVKIFVDELAGYLNQGKPVTLADAAFGNGADNSLMEEMSRRNLLAKLTAYAGWNTASNTCGYAISEGVLAETTSSADRKRLLTVRLLDEWAYQANVRQTVGKDVVFPKGANWMDLNPVRSEVEAATTERLQAFAAGHFPGFDVRGLKATHPWNRMFEVKIEFER
ncbi:MAG TPA: DUF4127 family protein [Patescibacteria group bacterium]|nr:DUF4127 family protein [Patescibacteria group bacterium]